MRLKTPLTCLPCIKKRKKMTLFEAFFSPSWKGDVMV